MRRAAVLVAVALAALVPARTLLAAPAGEPVLQRPNPALTPFQLDYQEPLRAASGGVASLAGLSPAVIRAAVDDRRFLAYQVRDDLGGFVPAPVGRLALQSGGHIVVGARLRHAQIPLFQQAAGGQVNSFTFTGPPPGGPPENGKQPVPGLGNPVPPPTPSGPQTPPTPPGNQGFGGRPGGNGSGGGTTTTTTTPKPPPTTPTTTTVPTTTTGTTATTTTATTGTTTAAPPPPVTVGGAGDCGTPGIAITSNLSGCRIDATNMKPGDSTAELVTVTNTTSTSYTLSLEATGTQNALWNDLQMGVWRFGDPAPSPLPPLLDWTHGFNDLRTLAPGESVTFEIELFLPTSAGNNVQNVAAHIDFVWHASG